MPRESIRAARPWRSGASCWARTTPTTPASLNNLAVLYQAMGEYARSRAAVPQGLAIRKKALGEDHPDYATGLNNLASLYQAMGDYARAEPLYRKALEIRKKALGENHPDYATSLNNLAVLYRAMGEYARPSRCSARPWRSGRRHWARTTPTTPRA